MTTVRDVFAFLEEKIPRSLSLNWDHDGLMCSTDLDAEVHKILLSLDMTREALRYAKQQGCNVCVTHHPLIFSPIDSVHPDTAKGQILIESIRSGVSVLSYHTRLDRLSGGVNDVLAQLLKLQDVRPFGSPQEEVGRIGALPAAMEFRSFCEMLRLVLGTPCLTCSTHPDFVRRIAVLGGSGKSDWQMALKAGADVFVTGEMTYNTMIDAFNEGFCVIEAGHDYTEKPVMQALEVLLKERFPNVETAHFDISSSLVRINGGKNGI